MTQLNIKIEELIVQKADDFAIAKVIKNEIKEYLSSLDEIFVESSGKDFFVKHTKKIDGFIKVIYKYLLRKHFGDYIPMSNSIPITIIALGSYGREQLCIYSDIDIMVMYDETKGYNLTPIIEEFMILSWDSGLKLGSRVHHLNQIDEAVKTDITIKTSILESRLIYGSKYLWNKFMYKLQKIRDFGQKQFVLEKLDEHKQRLAKYPLVMQPNIKDGYGGMRESNMLFWMANITYGVSNTKYLSGVLFSDEEYKSYRVSLEYIFRVRNALHLIAKKKQDIVTFDILPELSNKLGFKTTMRLSKERQCMARLFDALHIVHKFTTIMTKKIIRRYIFDPENYKHLKQNRISNRLYLCNHIVYTPFKNKRIKLNNLLKQIISLPNDVYGFDPSYVYFISNVLLPNSINSTTKKYIIQLFHKQNLYPILDLLLKTSLLTYIIPTFKKLINQPQFDGFHKHPVDIHSIRTLYHIENIKDPFLQTIYDNLTQNQKFILKISALMHDCGKGRGKDHHIVGQNLFKKFAISLKLSEENILIGSTLIRYHNMLNKVATTEDIYSQETILGFAGVVKSKEILDLLYLITYADINSVDSKLYKSSTSNLLKELYLQTIPAFDNSELLKVSSRRNAKQNTIKNHKLYQEQSRLLQKKILNIESNQLFLKFKALDIIELSISAQQTQKYKYKIFNDTHLKIRITRVVALNLGYLLGKLTFVNIVSMGIYKLFDGKKFFEIEFDEKLDDVDIPFVQEIIENSFDMSKNIKIKQPVINKEDININCEHTDQLAQMKVDTKDQKGLFSYIAKVFDDFGIEINSAKIQSKNGKANDMILIDKNGNFCKNAIQIVDMLTIKENINIKQ
jgi:[protein-PII] uridylyltransferase